MKYVSTQNMLAKNIYLQRYVTIKLGRYERNVIMLFGATYSFDDYGAICEIIFGLVSEPLLSNISQQ